MKEFMDKDFMLSNDTAQKLYHEHACKMPIIDYHCHLDPKMVAEDHRFKSITELWLGGDHYKWRALRANGVDEKYITGDASDWEKFEKWAETMPYCMRNPLYHWTHLELRTAFGITKLLNPSTAREIYDECNEKLSLPEYSARGFMKMYNVEAVCTTDDPVDSLEYHEKTKDDGFKIKMLPAWRPDKAMAIDKDINAFKAYISKLSGVSGIEINSYDSLIKALKVRHDFFAAHGCRLSDHGISRFYADKYTAKEVNGIFCNAMEGHRPIRKDADKYMSALLYDLAVMDNEAGWVQQFHYGPQRNNNSRMMKAIGADTGFDSIGEADTSRAMAHFFDRLDNEHALAKTIVYNINPSYNNMVATMIGNFQDGSVPGKIQWGAAWWFLDQEDGIRNQMNTLSRQGLLSRFVGMLTDSRSFLSYPRHEYFRRILCDMIGTDVENGELPYEEMPRIEQMIEDICYNNAKQYFNF
jgi:glucuronate isomerase